MKISIFRRDQKAAQNIIADENTEVKAGDVIEVSVVANKGFYAPDISSTGAIAAPGAGAQTTQSAIVGQ